MPFEKQSIFYSYRQLSIFLLIIQSINFLSFQTINQFSYLQYNHQSFFHHQQSANVLNHNAIILVFFFANIQNLLLSYNGSIRGLLPQTRYKEQQSPQADHCNTAIKPDYYINNNFHIIALKTNRPTHLTFQTRGGSSFFAIQENHPSSLLTDNHQSSCLQTINLFSSQTINKYFSSHSNQRTFSSYKNNHILFYCSAGVNSHYCLITFQ